MTNTTDLSTLSIDREVDRIYTQSNSENALTTPEKTIHLSHEGYSAVVVWITSKQLSLTIGVTLR